MGWFGGRKKGEVLDLTETMNKRHARAREIREDAMESSDDNPVDTGLGFLGSIANAATDDSSAESGETSDSEYVEMGGDAMDKRRRLTKRLMDMTEKIEDLGNQIYHLQQRIEVLERKSGVGGNY